MVSVEEILEELDAILDEAKVLPFSGGKAIVDTERMRTLIDDIRIHMPNEINLARDIASKRNDIISDARKDAEGITRKAENMARAAVNQDEIVRRAKINANEIIQQAQSQAREIRKGATDYSEDILSATEQIISQKLVEIRQVRQGLRDRVRQTSALSGDGSEKKKRSSTEDETDMK